MADLRVIDDRRAIATHLKTLRATLTAAAAEHVRNRPIGFPGGNWERDIYVFRTLGFYVGFADLDNRYWNGFGVDMPEQPGLLSLVVELNVPRHGIDRRIGAVFVEDMATREVLVAHRGKIGGGRAGVGNTALRDHYMGQWIQVIDGGQETELAAIAALGSEGLLLQVAEFVREVNRIKKLVVTGDIAAGPPRSSTDTFSPEFQGTSTYERTGIVEALAGHGPVVTALRQALVTLGYQAYNDRIRDLYIPATNSQPACLFEVKTTTDTTSIYAAVGQLCLHGRAASPDTILVLVVPDTPSRRFAGSLRQLGIRVVTYRWQGDHCMFQGLARALS